MSDFQFRTRGQQIPQGKQRVYFTCHPDDFEKFFEEIQKEILDRQDCAVFYLEPNTQPEDVEDYELRLREMQLFVVPVTTKLLTKANRAMDVEVPFAFEHHIPVLPLMQEGGLDDVFNKKFGDLQYLDKHNTDPTAIPYEEKLTIYLESVIVGDELAKKVRAAFDAYIFLSYRKKDRKYAQELMKLIHSNPLCRDIAIWYDEFLTPGENFNEAIRAALEKSELFALAVTPNLINEINYILTTEYPMACEMGKKILPAEMEATDRDKLGELYADLPELIANGDTAALKARLSDLLNSVAVQENDTDPQHNFFIGLAYLGGIDVEVNHERAVALITDSAEQGYIPAIEKLVSMYNTGKGVKLNYYQASKWQKKLVELRKGLYKAKPNKDTAKALLNDLWSLGTAYKVLGKFDCAKKTLEEMQLLSKEFISHYHDDSFFQYQIISLGLYGVICMDLGDSQIAEKSFMNALSICELFDEESYFFQKNKSLSEIYSCLGDNSKICGQLQEAEKWYYKRLKITAIRSNFANDVEHNQCLSVCYAQLGDVLFDQLRYDEAKKWYQKCLEITLSLAKESKSILDFRHLYQIYDRFGRNAQSSWHWNEAEEWYRKCVDICKVLVDTTGVVEDRRGLLAGYGKLGEIIEKRGDMIEAKKFYYYSMEIAKTLRNEINTMRSKIDLSVCYFKLGDISQKSGELKEAEEFFKESLTIMEELFMLYPHSTEIIHSIIIDYAKLGEVIGLQGNYVLAKKFLERCINICDSIDNIENTPLIYHDLEKVYCSLGCNAFSQNDYDNARNWFLCSLEINEKIIEKTNNIDVNYNLSVVCSYLGNIAEMENKTDEAEFWYKKSAVASELHFINVKTVESYDNLAGDYFNWGRVAKDYTILNKALTIWQQLLNEYPNEPIFQQRFKIIKNAINQLFSADTE